MTEEGGRRPARGESSEYRQGQQDALVRTIENNLQQLNASMREMQRGFQDLREQRVTREEFTTLEIKVESLTRWQWTIAGGLGLLVFLSQILPKIVETLRKP